jgi:hypothetical protein
MTRSRQPLVRRLLPGLFAGVALLAGCASGSDSATSPTPQPGTTVTESASASPTTSPTGPAEVAIEVTLVDGTVSPPPSRVAVALGSPVALTVSSDVADEIHVHGYELEEQVAAGESVTIRFTADEAGLFEVETHETEKLLLQLQVS